MCMKNFCNLELLLSTAPSVTHQLRRTKTRPLKAMNFSVRKSISQSFLCFDAIASGPHYLCPAKIMDDIRFQLSGLRKQAGCPF